MENRMGEKETKVWVVFLGKKDMLAGWPHHAFDIEKEADRLKDKLLSLQEEIENVEFSGWDLVTSDDELKRSISKISDQADGILVSPLTQEFADGNYTPNPGLVKLADMGKPMIVYTRPFSTYWDQSSRLSRKGKTEIVHSSDISDIKPALESMRAVDRLSDLTILMVKDEEYPEENVDPRMRDPRWMGTSYRERIEDIFGIEIKQVGSEELISAYENVDEERAKDRADKLIKSASELKEPSKEECIKATRMYLAMKELLEKNDANAMTVDCLTYIRAKMMPAAPCVGISLLHDQGIPASCEADIESLITIAICHALAERPGFQADPVPDESDNSLTMAHCLAPTRMLGYGSEQSPYYLRSHTESWESVGFQVEMEEDSKVTVLKLMGRIDVKKVGLPEVIVDKQFKGYNLLARSSKVIGNIDVDRGCRTKIKLPLENPKKFVENFHGQHRVVLYGDWTDRLKILSNFLGIRFVNDLCLQV